MLRIIQSQAPAQTSQELETTALPMGIVARNHHCMAPMIHCLSGGTSALAEGV